MLLDPMETKIAVPAALSPSSGLLLSLPLLSTEEMQRIVPYRPTPCCVILMPCYLLPETQLDYLLLLNLLTDRICRKSEIV
jgi:hypothetical protein